jgi:hypothetical protein
MPISAQTTKHGKAYSAGRQKAIAVLRRKSAFKHSAQYATANAPYVLTTGAGMFGAFVIILDSVFIAGESGGLFFDSQRKVVRRSATRKNLSKETREPIDKCANYLLKNKTRFDHATALANGWPIATGIIEGACRHLVKDRMDLTGAR